MGALVGIVIVVVIVLIIQGSAKKGGVGGTAFDKLVAKGVPARGILLQVAPRGVKTGTAQRRFEMRQVYIDVEIPGQPPYETQANPYIPMNLVRDVLPGATVELRVDPSNPRNMAIIGPGTGFVQTNLRTS